MATKGLMEGLPENLPELEDPYPICLFTNATKSPRSPTNDVPKFALVFMLQMYFSFFNVENIHILTQILWLHDLILHSSLYSHPEESVHLFTS